MPFLTNDSVCLIYHNFYKKAQKMVAFTVGSIIMWICYVNRATIRPHNCVLFGIIPSIM